MNFEMYFEPSPWEETLEGLGKGDQLDALRLLALTEEISLEDALDALEEKGVALDISGLDKLPAGEETALRLRQERQLVESHSLLTGLSETDPLRLYLEELAGTPVAGDMQRLAEEYAAGDREVLTVLTNGMLSLVVERAEKLAGRGVLLLDLIQEGSLGLWQGILHYTEGDFYAHCHWWIDFYMARAMVLCAKDGGIGQKMRQGMEDYLDADQKLLMELGRNPTTEEIAEALHVSAEEAYAYGAMVQSAQSRSRVDQEREEPEETPEDSMAVEDTAYFQSRQHIGELLSRLTEKEAQLLSLRFGLEGGLPASPEETGKRLKMTPEEVLQAEAAALKKLRENR